MNRTALIRVLALVAWSWFSRPARAAEPAATRLHFVENKAQWPAAVRFRAELPGGEVYLTRTGLVYDWHSPADLAAAHRAADHAGPKRDVALPVRGHAVFVDFIGAAAEPAGADVAPAYHNYFLGNDPRRWAAHARLFGQVRYPELYPGVALQLRGTAAGQLKYEFAVAPGAAAGRIGLRYRGAEGLRLAPDGSLRVLTSVTTVTEQRPYAYQLDAAGQRHEVPCRYRLEPGAVVRYEFPAGYDPARVLIIDPEVTAATYSGATGGFLYGTTATYDAGGDLLVAARTSGAGYPTTPGAYQATARQLGDIGLSKFDRNGRTLLFATYLGGNNLDQVRSLRTTANGDVYLYAETGSDNFPTTAGCYDNSYNGLLYDLAICRLRADGQVLLASTYLGSSGDERPADFAFDAAGNVVLTGTVSASTISIGTFPTTAGAFDRLANGFTDGFVARLNAQLTTLQWSTYLGGSGDDEPSGLQLARNGDVVLVGATDSPNYPTTTGTLVPTVRFTGDGFITRLRADGSALVASSGFGSSAAADNLRFVALDAADNVLVYGSTDGTLAATPGALSNAVGKVFISKLAADLRAVLFTALVPPYRVDNGSLNGLTAFGLDDCGRIFGAAVTTTAGLPQVSPLAGSTANGALYAFTLSPDGAQLEFGSYYGPPGSLGQSGPHVHSPVQRFDAQGRLYHALCVPDNQTVPTPPLAYARQARNTGFDVVGLKLVPDRANVSIQVLSFGASAPGFCAPLPLTFSSTGTNIGSYNWDFGDGSPLATSPNPSHTYQQPGRYRVRLTVTGPAGGGACAGAALVQDTLSAVVALDATPVSVLPATASLCGAPVLTLDAGNPGSSYQWSTGATTRSISVTQPGTYSVVISRGNCRLTSTVQVAAGPSADAAVADTAACTTEGVVLRVRAEPGSTFLWSTGQTTPSITVTESGTYAVQVSRGGCTQTLTRRVSVGTPPVPPNIITPNGDGDNDVFAPTALEPGTRLLIFNRWGRLVYRSDEYRNDWQASGQVEGTYYYLLENERFCFRRLKGWLEVVR